MSTAAAVAPVRSRAFGPRGPRRLGRVREEEHVYPLPTPVRVAWCAALRSGNYAAGALCPRDFHDKVGERYNPGGILRAALQLGWERETVDGHSRLKWRDGPIAAGETLPMVRYCRPSHGTFEDLNQEERDRFGIPRELIVMANALVQYDDLTFKELATWLEINTYDPEGKTDDTPAAPRPADREARPGSLREGHRVRREGTRAGPV